MSTTIRGGFTSNDIIPIVHPIVFDLQELVDKKVDEAVKEKNNYLHDLVCKRCKKKFSKIK